MNRCNEALEQVFHANPIIEKNKELIVRITKAVARLIATLTVFSFCSFGDSGDWRTMNGGARLSRFNRFSYLACITCATSITSSTISKLSIFKLQNWAFLLQWVVCWCNALLNFSFNYLLASPLLSQLFNYLPAILKCPFFNPHDWQLLALQKLFSCIHWVAWCTCSICNPAYQILSDQLEKQKKGRFMSIICQMTWNDQFSIFKSGTEPILSAPLSTFVNLAPTFASKFASWIQIRPLLASVANSSNKSKDWFQ